MRRWPRVSRSWIVVGTGYGSYDASLADFEAAARRDPKVVLTFALRGRLYDRLDGDTHRACGVWQNACRLGYCRLVEAKCAGR